MRRKIMFVQFDGNSHKSVPVFVNPQFVVSISNYGVATDGRPVTRILYYGGGAEYVKASTLDVKEAIEKAT